MEGFFDQEKTKAVVYLLAEGDDKNKILLSEKEILIIRHRRKHVFALQTIRKLLTENKKLLFPLIIGGILTPFAFLSYFVNLFLPWIHLVSIMIGMLLFYIGWNGKSTFTIIFKNGEELNFYLPSVSRNLLAFIDYTNWMLQHSEKSALQNLLFFEVDINVQKYLTDLDSNPNTLDLYPVYGFTYQQLKLRSLSMKSHNLIAIDPLKAGREIKFYYDPETNLMRPRLDGPIVKNSIIDTANLYRGS